MNDNNTVNKVFLLGEISRAPRWHRTGKDGQVLCFTITTKEIYRQQGKMVEHAEEHAVKVSEKRFDGELRQGQKVHIEGKLKTTAFQDEQSVRRYKTEVLALKVTVIS